MVKKQLTEILFTTDCPVNISVRHDGVRWYVARVIVEDTDIDLDPKQVRAYDPINDAELATAHPTVLTAIQSLNDEEWPAWEFGS